MICHAIVLLGLAIAFRARVRPKRGYLVAGGQGSVRASAEDYT